MRMDADTYVRVCYLVCAFVSICVYVIVNTYMSVCPYFCPITCNPPLFHVATNILIWLDNGNLLTFQLVKLFASCYK